MSMYVFGGKNPIGLVADKASNSLSQLVSFINGAQELANTLW